MTETDTDELLDHFKSNAVVEVDHALTLYLAPGKRLPWRDTNKIREHGYKIQGVTNKEHRTKITLVQSQDGTGTNS
jgi:hypothetical protein